MEAPRNSSQARLQRSNAATVIIAILLPAAAFLLRETVLSAAKPSDPSQPVALQTGKPHLDEPRLPAAGLPARLIIPRLGINAAVEHVALTPEGDMDVPKDWNNVGWYSPGTRPGEAGNAVIAGHLDSTTGPAVFWKLNSLKPGDIFSVVDDRGQIWSYIVTRADSYDLENAPLNAIFGPSAESNVNLITCDGKWNRGEGKYEQRLAVSAQAFP